MGLSEETYPVDTGLSFCIASEGSGRYSFHVSRFFFQSNEMDGIVANEMVADPQHVGLLARMEQWWAERAPRGEFWALVAAALLFNVGVSIFFFLYNLLMLDLGFRERSLGVLASAMALGSVAGTIPMGIIAQRFGLKKVLSVCLVLLAAAFGARVFLFWYPAQLAFAFFDGVMLCGWVVCLSPAVANVVEEEKRPFAFSLLFAVAVATGSLGGAIGGNMPGWSQSLAAHLTGAVVSAVQAKKITLLAACILTSLAAWPVTRLKGGAPPQFVRRIQRPSPFLLRFLLANACWAAAVGAFNPFTNVFFVQYLRAPTAHLGNFFSVAQLLQAGAVLLMPFIARRTGLINGIVAAQLTTAVAVAMLAAGRGLLQEEVIYCCFMAAQHMCDPGLQSLLMDGVAPEERSGAAALNFLVMSIAQAGSATAAGAAFGWLGYPAVLVGAGAATAAAAVAFRVLCAPREELLTESIA
jgi:MFS family permease